MADPAEGIKDLLVAAGVGTFAATTGWGIFIGREPGEIDSIITIYHTGGRDPNSKWLLDFPSIQVKIRGDRAGYQAAHAKAIDVRDALLGLPGQDINGDRWDLVVALGGVNNLGFDEKNRPMFTVNFELTIEPATGTYRQAFP